MKTIINKIYILLMIVFFVSACSDFLNKEPLSQGTEAIVFKTAEHFEQAANALYNLEGWKNYDGSNIGDRLDKNLDISGLRNNGGEIAPEDNDRQWNKPYSYIRGCNILLKKAEEYAGSQTEIAHSVGTAYFFRAWQHFYMLQIFGGIPIVDQVLDLNDDVLYGSRNSRYEVIYFIISDLEQAVNLLTKESDISESDKGKVSKEAAKSFLARVMLYEATWEKYASNISDLDGDGINEGGGKSKPDNYPTIEEMFTKAKELSAEVIQEAEKGTYSLWDKCDSLSYFYLFNLDDGEGNLANFNGVGKSTNKEFIFYKIVKVIIHYLLHLSHFFCII